jgi:hypothetical protein
MKKYIKNYVKKYYIILSLLIIIFILYKIFSSTYKENFTNNMSNYSVIFAGTCRNVDKYIETNLKNIDKCGNKFKSYKLIIYENDSTDRTRELLVKNKKKNYTYIFEDNIVEPKRTLRLANGRNKLLKMVRETNKDLQYDFLIMIDLDDINNNGMFVDTIDTCFKYNDWDVMTATQQKEYYDVWALRKKDVLDFDFVAKNISGVELNKKIFNYISNTSKDTKLIDVDSAFGGIAIYKLSSIPDNCNYIGVKANGEEDCEHVEFNKCIKNNNGKIYINREFYNK